MHHGEGSPSSIPAIRLASGPTIVAYTRAGDRWRHEISTADGGLWQSVEGTTELNPDPCWPASPVLTEVSLMEAAGGPALLGLGLAGRSHFSLCVTVHPDEPESLLFEAACRLSGLVGWLGSTYREPGGRLIVLKAVTEPLTPPTTVCWSYLVGPAGLRHLPLAPPGDRARGR